MSKEKNLHRKSRHARIRKKMHGTAACPRLCIFRSLRSIYAQLIDDDKGRVLASTSDLKDKSKETKTLRAKRIGLELAKKAIEAKIENCVFDRAGYRYHGRVKALAEGAREGGLKF